MGYLDARSGVSIRIPRRCIVYMALSCDGGAVLVPLIRGLATMA